MGWANTTATGEKDKYDHSFATKTKKFTPVEEKQNEDAKDDWWEKIKKEHEEKKK